MNSMQRLNRRIESLEALLPRPAPAIDWYELLEDSGLYGQNRADFEAFLSRIRYKDLKDLTDDELFTLESWVKEID